MSRNAMIAIRPAAPAQAHARPANTPQLHMPGPIGRPARDLRFLRIGRRRCQVPAGRSDGVPGLVSAILIIVGVRLHRAPRPVMWSWLAAGLITWVIGDLVWQYYKYV